MRLDEPPCRQAPLRELARPLLRDPSRGPNARHPCSAPSTYPHPVFKRRSSTVVADPEPSTTGKGRPTPSRKSAEAARAARVKPPKDTREARRLERQRAAKDRVSVRKAIAAGDPKFLPARDRGPAKAWIRNLIDSRWSPGELILPAALMVFFLSLVTKYAYLVFYVLVISAVFDSVVLARQITKGLKENFPEEPLQGTKLYGILRASQFRRMRVPKPAAPRAPLVSFRRKPKD
jgi:Protein of unknown function (DUF3043)